MSSHQRDALVMSSHQTDVFRMPSRQMDAPGMSSQQTDVPGMSLHQMNAPGMPSHKMDPPEMSSHQMNAPGMPSHKMDPPEMSSHHTDAFGMPTHQRDAPGMSSQQTDAPGMPSHQTNVPGMSSHLGSLSIKCVDVSRLSLDQTEAKNMSSDQTLVQRTSSDPMQLVNCVQDADRNCVECDVCMEANPDETQLPTASKLCIECEQNLCSRCINDHRRQKLLKDHDIVDIPCQMEAKPNQKSSDCYREPIPQAGHDSSKVFPVYLSTTEIQQQTSATDVLAAIERERDRHTKYEKDMSAHINQLLKKQDETKKTEENIRKMIIEKYSNCVARLQSDKDFLLEQLGSNMKILSSENETKLRDAMSYLDKIRDPKKNFEPETFKKRLVETNDELDRSLLLHVHFQRPIHSLDDVSFCKSLTCTEKDNTIGKLEGLTDIQKIEMGPTLKSYMKFLENVFCRTADARKLHWKLTMHNEEEMKGLYEMNFLQGVHDELELSIADKKRDELQKGHTRLASLVFEVTKPTSESSAEEYESHLAELTLISEKLWNTIQFQFHYKNSEKGLKPEGFQNFGNTCYFNSVFQCLVQTVLLPFELTPNLYGLGMVMTKKEKMSSLSRGFMELTSNYKVSEQRKEALEALYNKFRDATPRFSDQSQHDSHDLLINLLDKLRVEERNEWHKAQTQKALTAVDRIFGGQFITVYTCHSCQDPYGIREPFLDISIPLCKLIPDDQKPKDNRGNSKYQETFAMPGASASEFFSVRCPSRNEEAAFVEVDKSDASSQHRSPDEDGNTVRSHLRREAHRCRPPDIDDTRREAIKSMLQPIAVELSAEPEVKNRLFDFFKASNLNVSQCLKYFTRAEAIKDEYLCRNCQLPGSSDLKMTSATKRTLISSPPAVLVLHLKRFEQRSSGFVKRDEMISYDELLDLGSFCSCSALRIDPKEENVWYSLYGVVVHSGFFLSRGHYVAYVKQRDSSALLDDQLREKFLQKNLVVGHDVVPNNDDSATMEKRNAIKQREKAKPANPIPGQWFYISDDSVRLCDEKEALSQKAFLLFYERIPGTVGKNTGV